MVVWGITAVYQLTALESNIEQSAGLDVERSAGQGISTDTSGCTNSDSTDVIFVRLAPQTFLLSLIVFSLSTCASLWPFRSPRPCASRLISKVAFRAAISTAQPPAHVLCIYPGTAHTP